MSILEHYALISAAFVMMIFWIVIISVNWEKRNQSEWFFVIWVNVGNVILDCVIIARELIKLLYL